MHFHKISSYRRCRDSNDMAAVVDVCYCLPERHDTSIYWRDSRKIGILWISNKYADLHLNRVSCQDWNCNEWYFRVWVCAKINFTSRIYSSIYFIKISMRKASSTTFFIWISFNFREHQRRLWCIYASAVDKIFNFSYPYIFEGICKFIFLPIALSLSSSHPQQNFLMHKAISFALSFRYLSIITITSVDNKGAHFNNIIAFRLSKRSKWWRIYSDCAKAISLRWTRCRQWCCWWRRWRRRYAWQFAESRPIFWGNSEKHHGNCRPECIFELSCEQFRQ